MIMPLFFKKYSKYKSEYPTATAFFDVTLLVVVYFAVGCAFYMKQEGWTFVDAFYFSMVTMSTVGYGDLSPTKGGSKFFTILFVIFGITVPFVRLSNFVATIGFAAEERCVNFIKSRLRGSWPPLRPRKEASTSEGEHITRERASRLAIQRHALGVPGSRISPPHQRRRSPYQRRTGRTRRPRS